MKRNTPPTCTKNWPRFPGQFGFDSARDFIHALKRATRGAKQTSRTPGKRRRATITDDMRAEVKRRAGAGETSAAIAKKVGISLPSVQLIKKALGLVKKRKK